MIDVQFQDIPYRTQEEGELIGCLLVDSRRFDEVRLLVGAEDFTDDRWSTLFMAIENLLTSGKTKPPVDQRDPLRLAPLDLVPILHEYRRLGGAEISAGEIAKLINRTGVDWRWYAKRVQEAASMRLLARTVSDVAQSVSDNADPVQVWHEAEQVFFQRAPREQAAAFSLADTRHYQMLVDDDPTSLISTGYPALDQAIGGGLIAGRTYVIGGRPGKGKTSLSLNIACHMAFREGARVTVVSLEQTLRDVIEQIVASENRSTRANSRDVMDFLEWHRDQASRIHVVDQSDMTAEQIVGLAREHSRRWGLDLLVVDYLQLVRGSGDPKLSRAYQLEHACRLLHCVAKELKIALLLCAQLSREADKEIPSMRHLKDSGSIEQFADFIGLLYRKNVTEPAVSLLVPKNRYGPDGISVHLLFHGQYKRFDSVADRKQQKASEELF